jgi:DNA-binding transcriptional MocR family regulator
MILTVNKKTNKTVFDQILNQLTELIDNGTLSPGSRLPSTRELAKTSGVNRSTVLHVYEELWAQGYIESTPGSYTLVRKRKPVIHMKTDDEPDSKQKQNRFRHQPDLKYDLMMYYLENGKDIEKGKINFLQLSPDTRLLDRNRIKSCMRNVLNVTEANPFDFTHARGYPPLRKELVKHMKLHNIHAEDKNILVTNSSLQSLQLIFQVFSKPGDTIVLEEPSSSLIFQFIKIFQLKPIEIPITDEGMDLAVLKKVLRKTPVRFIYTLPTYQNPTGISMPQNKREELVYLCENKDCIIIEDSIEEEMEYYGRAHLPIKSIDQTGQVIYLGSFAKVLAPGLRIGWLVGSAECIKKLTVVKSILEISSTTISQMLLYELFTRGVYEIHLRKTMKVFRKRMKVAISSIKKYLPESKIEWSEPKGGYMIWIKLLTKKREHVESHFSEQGVMVHNGKYFFSKEPNHDYIRICISQTNEAEIEEGIKRLGKALLTL